MLKTNPDWNRLPEPLHPRLKQMLERCLTKRPRDRYACIADARVDIEAALRDPHGAETSLSSNDPTRSGRQRIWPIAAAFAIGVGVTGIFCLGRARA